MVETTKDVPESALDVSTASKEHDHDEHEGEAHEDEQIFAYLRTCGKEQSVVLINLSLEEATYDPAIVENAEVLIGTNPNPEKGVLRPLEAVIYHIMY